MIQSKVNEILEILKSGNKLLNNSIILSLKLSEEIDASNKIISLSLFLTFL